MKISIPARAAAALIAFLGSPALHAEQIYATNGASITRFNTTQLRLVATVPITGLQPGEKLVGIDLRPSNGVVYGLSSMSRMFTIDASTGVATHVGNNGAFTLTGTMFGMDFNPAADRIREVSDTEQNQRLNPDTGVLSVADTSLTPAGNIVAVAYSSNFAGAIVTQLYAIDSSTGQLELIGGLNSNPSPNTGAVTAIGSLGLGTNLNPNIGFDISGATGVGYATITVGGQSRLYSINFATGAATNLGKIGSGATPYLGMTVGPELPLPSDKAPTVTISGKQKQTTGKTKIRLSGTATDDFTVAKVEYSTGNGKFLPANGTSNWSVNLKLTKPVTRVTVRAIDDANAASATATVVVRRTR